MQSVPILSFFSNNGRSDHADKVEACSASCFSVTRRHRRRRIIGNSTRYAKSATFVFYYYYYAAWTTHPLDQSPVKGRK